MNIPINDIDKHLDHSESKNRFSWMDGQVRYIRLYIDGIQCGACVWLLEQLHNLDAQIIRSKLDFGQSILTVGVTQDASLARVSSLIRSLGYTPTAIERHTADSTLWRKERKKLLSQIGIGAFVSGNIMLLSVSIYAGASGIERSVFEWLSFGLSLPVVLWIGLPFYRRALSGIVSGHINIDLSVTIAMLGGFGLSTWNLLHHSSQLYYDSITTFAFLLLSTRFLLKSIHYSFSQSTAQSAFGRPEFATIIAPHPRHIPIDEVPIGSEIRVERQCVIPLDGVLISPHAYIDAHLLTGESAPQKHLTNEAVFAMTTNVADPIIIRTTGMANTNRISQLLSGLHLAHKPRLAILSDRVAKWFVIGIFVLALVVGGYHWILDQNGLRYVLGLIMVSCPCALALTTPLIYTLGINKAAKLGIFVKDADVFDRLSKCDTVFFDKTGTLTSGQLSVETCEAHTSEPITYWHPIIAALESTSRHPIARALCRYVGASTPLPHVDDYTEIFGKGVQGTIDGIPYFLGKLPETPNESPRTPVGLYRNHDLVLTMWLSDVLKPDSEALIHTLHSHGFMTALLSGDHEPIVKYIADSLGITRYIANATPEEKYKAVTDSAIMVGDGANDALALASANVGIAVQGSLAESLKTASVYLANHQMGHIVSLIIIAAQVRQTIVYTLIISTLYNVVGIGLVLAGWVSPLLAAILMPTSSLTVTLLAIWGIHRRRETL